MDPLALIVARIKGDLAAVRSLLRAGADVHAREPSYQYTALSEAAYKGHTAVVRELLRAGARVEDKDINGCTALDQVFMEGYLDVVRVLLAAGASVHTRNKKQQTPLYGAAEYGQAAVIRVLVHEGRARVEDKDVDGGTALHIACQNGQVEAVCALLAARADVHARTKLQANPCTQRLWVGEKL